MFFTKCRCFQRCQEPDPEESSVFFGCRRLKFEGTLTLNISYLPQHTQKSEIASGAVLIRGFVAEVQQKRSKRADEQDFEATAVTGRKNRNVFKINSIRAAVKIPESALKTSTSLF